MKSNAKHTWVCFSCMKAARIPERAYRSKVLEGEKPPTCPACGGHLRALNTRIRIPKRKPKLWRAFKDWLSSLNPYYKELVK